MGKPFEKHYGDKVVVAFAHGFDAKVGHEYSIHGAAETLVSADVDVSCDVYQAQHGTTPGSPNPCDGPDQYHENLDHQYETVSAVLSQRIAERADLTIRHVYGAGAGDPDAGHPGPKEALEADAAQGVASASIIPYEFWGDTLDNLVYLREKLGFEPEQSPYYDAAYETHMTHRGVEVLVASADFQMELKADALMAAIAQSLAAELGGDQA